jgi:hypothetical protein
MFLRMAPTMMPTMMPTMGMGSPMVPFVCMFPTMSGFTQ